MIDWKRGRRDTTYTSKRMTWKSRCGRYRVEEHKSLFDDTVRYIPIVDDVLLTPNKTYRKRHTAERACNKHAGFIKTRKKNGRSRRQKAN